MFEMVPAEKLKTMIGQDNGVSDWVLIDQERVNRFADATDDHQWIHVDVEQAVIKKDLLLIILFIKNL